MDALKGDSPARTGSFMPPATTRRFPERPTATREARIAPPFVPSEPAPQAEAEAVQPEPQPEPQPVEAAAEPAATESTESVESEVIEIDLGLDMLVEEEGVVEPAFAVDAEAVLRELGEQAAELSQHQELPLQAFGMAAAEETSVPDFTEELPESEAQSAAGAAASPAASLAERLEQLSQQLREEHADEIVRRLAAGDRLDALLAGLLAGYLAGKSEQ